MLLEINDVIKKEEQSGEVYSLQHYVIKFVRNLRKVGGFLRVFRFIPKQN
jgi:hypothetical protein